MYPQRLLKKRRMSLLGNETPWDSTAEPWSAIFFFALFSFGMKPNSVCSVCFANKKKNKKKLPKSQEHKIGPLLWKKWKITRNLLRPSSTPLSQQLAFFPVYLQRCRRHPQSRCNNFAILVPSHVL